MKGKIITEKDRLLTAWSGGTTTQLYISPLNAIFSDRNFDFRISSAVIELEESNFTPLPGFSRIIMVLEGRLEISHEGLYSKILERFDTDSFSGDWSTSSKGKVTDFNLIMGEGVTGSLTAIHLKPGVQIDKIIQEPGFLAYYVVSGKLKLNSIGSTSLLKEGEMIVLESEGKTTTIQLEGECEMIEIWCEK